MEEIVSVNNKRIKEYRKLLDKKYRDKSHLFIIEGENIVREAYKTKRLVEVLKCSDVKIDLDCKMTNVSYDVIKSLSNTKTPQKVMGICKLEVPKKIGNRVLILEDIQDPGNLGTIIRSSVAFNVDTIILGSRSVDLYNDKVIRSSEGMIFKINIIRSDVSDAIDALKRDGYKIYGTKVDNGSDVRDIMIPKKYALVMGNEGNGVRLETLEKCDDYLYINMNSKVESLNVGVATSIILYELDNKVK